jgi:hypothetical protein
MRIIEASAVLAVLPARDLPIMHVIVSARQAGRIGVLFRILFGSAISYQREMSTGVGGALVDRNRHNIGQADAGFPQFTHFPETLRIEPHVVARAFPGASPMCPS